MTKPEEFEKFLSLLTPEQISSLWLGTLDKGTKFPPLAKEPKNPKNRIEPYVALDKMRKGFNIYIYATGELGFIDLDVEKGQLKLPAEKHEAFPRTLTQTTRNGGKQLFYTNKTGLGNKILRYEGKNIGELRAEWYYVVAPGSYVAKDNDASQDADGYYKIIDALPIAELEKIPNFIEVVDSSEAHNINIDPEVAKNPTNELGYPLDLIMERDPKLAGLLTFLDTEGYPSRSEADMAAAAKLWFWRFNENQIAGILRKFRPYEKTARIDYLATTISKITGGERYQPKKGKGKKEKETGKELPPIPEEAIDSSPCGLDELLSTYKKWLYIEEDYSLIAPICAYLGNFAPGEPDVIGIIQPSGSLKTEILRSLGETENQYCYPLSTITEHTLISGLRENIDTVPLLRGRPLVIKDLTTLLSTREDVRAAIFAQFRELTDGYIRKEFGNGVKKEYRDIHSSIIFASTSAIERYTSLYSNLGARIIFFRPKGDRKEATRRSEANREKLKEMRAELHNIVMRFISTYIIIIKEKGLPAIPQQVGEALIDLCDFVAKVRTNVHHDYKTGDIDELPDPEFPTRIYNTLSKLVKIHMLINGRNSMEFKDFEFALRILLDNIPKIRVRVLEQLSESYKTTPALAQDTELPTNTLKYILSDLVSLRIASRLPRDMKDPDEDEDLRSDSFKLTSSIFCTSIKSDGSLDGIRLKEWICIGGGLGEYFKRLINGQRSDIDIPPGNISSIPKELFGISGNLVIGDASKLMMAVRREWGYLMRPAGRAEDEAVQDKWAEELIAKAEADKFTCAKKQALAYVKQAFKDWGWV